MSLLLCRYAATLSHALPQILLSDNSPHLSLVFKVGIKQGVVAHTFIRSTQEAKTGRSLWVQGQPCLQSKFQNRQGWYTEKSSLRIPPPHTHTQILRAMEMKITRVYRTFGSLVVFHAFPSINLGFKAIGVSLLPICLKNNYLTLPLNALCI